MSEIIHTRALLLKRVAYREADWICTLLCRDLGKVSVLARSARRSQKRFAGALTWFAVSDAEIKKEPNRELQVLTSAHVIESHAEIAIDMGAFAQASYAVEVIRELTTTGQADSELFDLLVELFRLLARGPSVPGLRGFELKALASAGFLPVFSCCVACDGEAADGGAVLDVARGGVLCRTCAALTRASGVRPLSNAARACISELLLTPDLPAAAAVNAPADVLFEVRGALGALIGHHITKPLKTLDFVDKLRAKPGLEHHQAEQGGDGRHFKHDNS